MEETRLEIGYFDRKDSRPPADAHEGHEFIIPAHLARQDEQRTFTSEEKDVLRQQNAIRDALAKTI